MSAGRFIILNERQAARHLRDLWLRQFGKERDCTALAAALRALGPDSTADEVDRTFAAAAPARGHTNRVPRKFTCTLCGKVRVRGVRIVMLEEDCDLCTGCLRKICKAVHETSEEGGQ